MNTTSPLASRLVVTAICLLGAAGCGRSTLDLPSADTNADGLARLSGLDADEAWAKPGLDLGTYERLLIAPTEFSFRDVRQVSRLDRTGTRMEFPIDEADRKRLEEMVATVLREELSGSRNFSLTEEPGPGVLVVATSLLDIVSRVPPEIPARSDVYLDRIADATTVVELSDAVSREKLLRAVDRRSAETLDSVGGLRRPTLANRSSSVTNWNEINRELRRWARSVRNTLDELHEQSPL